MGTSAGPSLAGIGRGGDSNLVLEMDAHDAKSYPGEPTTNTIINGYFPGTDTTTVPTGWALHYSASKIGFRPAGEDFFYKNLGLSNPRVYKCNGGGWYSDTGTGFIGIVMPQPTPGFSTSTATTVSFWYRFTGENAAQLSNQTIFFDFDYGLANLTKINYTDYNDTEWHFYSETLTSSGSYAYYNLYIYAGSLYSVCPGGSYFEIGAVQVEQKGYATPFVGDGQFARPASTNLMIHASSSNAGVNAFGVNGGQSGWTGWTLAGGAATSTDYTYNGPTSIKCVSLSQTMQSPTFSTVSGKSYRVSYWTYCSTDTTGGAGNEHSELYVYDGNGTSAVYNPTWALAPLGSWIHVTRTFTSSVTGSSAYMKIHPDDNETIYFADVVVEDADQIIMDSSPSKHTVTVNGDVTHSSAQSKFSGGSVYFDGTGDYLNVSDSTDWEFSNGVFTIDFWFKNFNTATGRGVISISNASVASNYESILVYTSGGSLVLYSSSNNTWDIAGAANMGAFGSGWVHYAIVRESVAGNIKLYNNGALQTTVSTSATLRAVDAFRIGQRVSESNGASCYLDEIRITKGTALWTADFTPPTRRNLSAPVVDRSGNDNGGNFATKETTDVTNYRVGEVIRPIDSAVWDFDGTDDAISIKTDAFDLKCFTVAIKQGGVHAGPFPAAPGQVNVGMNIGTGGFNGIIMGSWTGTMDDETLSLWGYNSTPSTGSSATYIKDEIKVGWHIFTFNWNGSDYDIWVDGTKRITFARGGGSGHSGLLSGVTAIYPGRSLGWSTDYFEGNIGFFRAYDKSLSDQQIIENFYAKRNSLNIANWSNRDIVQSGLIRWLDFGEAACYPGGTIGTVNDLKTGTAYTVSNSGGGITPSGEGGGCFAFAGTTDDKIPFTATANLYACTVSVWVYNLSGGDTRQTLFGHYFELLADRLQMYSYGFTSLGWRFSTSGSVPYNTWTNAVMTWDGTNVKAYINGALNYTNTVGAGGYAGGFYEISVTWARLKAKLATALIYDRALSASELEQNFIVQKQRFGV
jgi:hypothetical protein